MCFPFFKKRRKFSKTLYEKRYIQKRTAVLSASLGVGGDLAAGRGESCGRRVARRRDPARRLGLLRRPKGSAAVFDFDPRSSSLRYVPTRPYTPVSSLSQVFNGSPTRSFAGPLEAGRPRARRRVVAVSHGHAAFFFSVFEKHQEMRSFFSTRKTLFFKIFFLLFRINLCIFIVYFVGSDGAEWASRCGSDS